MKKWWLVRMRMELVDEEKEEKKEKEEEGENTEM